VDLTGGVKMQYAAIEDPRPAPAPVQSDFVASLDDLGLLMESLAGNQPAPPSPADQPPDGLVSLDAFEPVVDAFEDAAPVAQPFAAAHGPMDFFEDAAVAPLADPVPTPELPAQPPAVEQPLTPLAVVEEPVPLAAAEQPLATAAVEQPVPAAVAPLHVVEEPAPLAAAEQPLATAAVEQPVPAAVAPLDVVADPAPLAAEAAAAPVPPPPLAQAVEPPVAAAAAQHTVALLMPVGQEDDVRPEAVAQFSTLELLDIVAQLVTTEEPGKKEPAAESGPEPTVPSPTPEGA
jgi:hypothetical protein